MFFNLLFQNEAELEKEILEREEKEAGEYGNKTDQKFSLLTFVIFQDFSPLRLSAIFTILQCLSLKQHTQGKKNHILKVKCVSTA